MTTLSSPDLQRALDGLQDATSNLPSDAYTRIVTGSWSLAQVLEHLGKAYGGTAHILEKAVRDGAPKGAPPGVVQRLIASLILRGWYSPRGIKSPAVALPDGVDATVATGMALSGLTRLDAACREALAAFGPEARVANHPMLGGFTVPQWRTFHRWHTEHHLRQIRAAFR